MPVLDWIGKQAVINHHAQVPYRLVHCDGVLSAGLRESGNLLVQGDNLQVLKALLPYYATQVKCIYIDPPYNTGNEGWIYNDNVNSPEMKQWLGRVVGKQAEDLSRHDKWLCMMYPRLRLLREFLRDDGVIFVSIDDNEQAHLKLLMDEIFGERNFVANFIWHHRKSSQNDIDVSLSHNYTFSYARNRDNFRFKPIMVDNTKFSNPDNDLRGAWIADPMDAPNIRENLSYPIKNPNTDTVHFPPKGRHWRFTQEKYFYALQENRIVFGKNGRSKPQYKRFLSEAENKGVAINTIWSGIETATDATKKLMAVFDGEKVFETPKPTSLINKIISISCEKDDIILDSFAGSGTTGHAVLAANAADGGNRRFILVEMMEEIAKNVTAQRLSRIINGYDKGGDAAKLVAGLGGGFRFCRLGKPLFDETGNIGTEVTFPDLAAHVFFIETGTPLPARVDGSSPLIGTLADKAIYLFYAQESQGFAHAAAGNVLTLASISNLPLPWSDFQGQKIIYAEGCTISPEKLASENITFKQIPYQIKGS